MRRMAIALTAAALLVSAGLSAQAPNFAGKWTLVPPPDAAAGGGGGGKGGGKGGGGGGAFCGMECTITQDAKALTVARMAGGAEVKATYNLDGSASKNSMSFGGNTVESTSTAKADGGKLVITTKQQGQAGEVTRTTTLSLDAGNLKVETTGPGREGTPQTTTQTYKKG
jgi:hypothetical protein